MSLRSPRSPTDFNKRGFQPLSTVADNNMSNYDQDIPLEPVKTNHSTGARKPGEGVLQYDLSTAPTLKSENEKSGLFNRRAAGRRKIKKMDSKKRVGTDGEEIAVNGLGKLYHKIVTFSVVTRYIVYVAPLAIIIATPIVVFAIVNPEADIGGMRAFLFFGWIEIIWLSLWVSKLLAQTIPWIFMFLCGVVSSGTRKYAMILKAVETPLSLLGWAVATLVTFTALTSDKLNPKGVDHWSLIMTRVLVPIMIGAGLLLGEKLIIQLISINYHRRSFDAKIRESKHLIHLLGLLYDASRTLFPMYCPEFLEDDYAINDSIEAMLEKTGYHHKHSGSVTPLKLIGDVGRFGDKVTSVFGNIASEITGKQVFNPTSAHSIVVEALEKKSSSEALAKRLWMSFVVEGKESLYAEDIEEVLGPSRRDEAHEIFAALDQDQNGDISLDEMIMKVVEIGRDRKAIASSMRDVGQAIGVLDQVLVFILAVIVVFIFVAFQNTSFVTTLATAGTTLLSLSFVFAVTTQEFLGSCIFLFVKHPYDVGDRVDIVGPEKEWLVVEQISLLYTVFKRIDTMKMVQVPNIVLNTLWIENVTRSNAMKEQLDMFIAFDTTIQDIDTLRSEMETFVHHPDNARDFQPEIILETTGLGKMDALQLKVEIRHKGNWHNESVRAARRSKFVCALVLAMRKVPIYGPGGGGAALGDPKNPSYSVAISNELAMEARQKAKDDMEGKRLIPSAPPAPSTADSKSTAVESSSISETRAAEHLNARKPTDFLGGGWTSRDDTTLGVERGSFDSQRNEEIDNLREGLLKRESTRGRRKPGEAIPAFPMPNSHFSNSGGNPGVTVTASSPGFRSQVAGALDEEMEVGIHHSHLNNNHGNQHTARDIRTEVLNPGTGPQAGAGMMVQPRYVFPPTTPEAGGVGGRDYLAAGSGVPPVPGAQGAQVGRMASTEGQSALRGLTLAQSEVPVANATARPAGSQNPMQRQGQGLERY